MRLPSTLLGMVAPPLIFQVFAQAWRLAEDLDDAGVQDRLVGLRRRSCRLPEDRQTAILTEVAALTEQLRSRQEQGRGRWGHER